MFQDKYVFSQLTAFLNRTQFNNYVRKYDGNRYVKHFTCWNQMLAMMFRSWTDSQDNSCDSEPEPWLQNLRRLCILYDEGSLREADDQHPWHFRKEICVWFNNDSVVSCNIPMGKVPKQERRGESSYLIRHWSTSSCLLYCNYCIKAWFHSNVFNPLWTKCLLYIRQGLWLL